MKLKRAWPVTSRSLAVSLALSLLTLSLAGFSTGCGPEEKYCYDQHETCKQAVQDKKDKAQQEEEERLRRLDALGIMSDAGSTVVGE
jgi:hypothetical protein